MLETALRKDALTITAPGFELRVGLPWIRSMLPKERAWWFIQDRLVLAGGCRLEPGVHAVSVDFQLLVPYLQARPGSPLVLPFHLEAQLDTRRPSAATASRDVA